MLENKIDNCATTGLSPYTSKSSLEWNDQRICHIARRLATGISGPGLIQARSSSPENFIDGLITTSVNAVPPEWPYWAKYGWVDLNNIQFFREYVLEIGKWIESMHHTKTPILSKMMLFWSNHFVVQNGVVEQTALMYQYLDVLRRYALGNFKDFVKEISKDGAMLLYLNGAESTKNSPNENYARELFELFTLGEGNGYTQTDIVEASRALTGYVVRTYMTVSVTFDPRLHDSTNKTIFGRTGNWDTDALVDILFEERADLIAYFICKKIYQHFVHPVADESIVNDLATIFMDNDWELLPVLETLFRSEHFVDDKVIGTIIKSPFNHATNLVTMLNLPFDAIAVPQAEDNDHDLTWGHICYYFSATMGQTLLEPVDVAGWPGNRYWLTSDVLSSILQFGEWSSYVAVMEYNEMFIDLAKDLSNNSTDPEFVTKSVVDFYVPHPLNQQDLYDSATAVFKGDIPENYFANGNWNLDWDHAKWQIQELIKFIVKLPEFLLG